MPEEQQGECIPNAALRLLTAPASTEGAVALHVFLAKQTILRALALASLASDPLVFLSFTYQTFSEESCWAPRGLSTEDNTQEKGPALLFWPCTLHQTTNKPFTINKHTVTH